MKYLFVIPILLMLLVGCSGNEEATDQALETGSILPSDYISYTDTSGLFSVSYPANWEVILNPIGVEVETMENQIEKTNAGTLDKAGPVFFWGVPADDGFNPSCNVVVEPRDESNLTIQEVMDETIGFMDLYWGNFQVISQETEVIDGKDSAILEYTAAITGTAVHSLILLTMDNDTIWTSACIVRVESVVYNDFEDDIHNVVRSLEIRR